MVVYRDTKAGRLFTLFDGVSRLAAELGVSKSVVSRWDSERPRGNHGHIPTHYNARIMDRAKALNLDAGAVLACLDQPICPCCKRPLDPGQVISRRGLRSLLRGIEGGGAA